MHFSPKIQDILFGLILVVMSVIYYDGILDKGPTGAHGWRQADSVSLTQNYEEGAPFLEPQMHILLADNYTTGKSAGEFPIMYYTVGKIWQVFGQSYLSYRLFYLVIFLVSLFLLYKATLLVLQDWVWAAFITLLTFCSPNFVAYATSFITDGPSVCFTFIGLFFITKYGISRSLKWFYFGMAFFALAGLIKVSSLIAFFFLLFIFLIERFPVKSLGNRKLFARPLAEGIGFLAVLGSIFAWYAYAEYYNNIHGFRYTFNGIYPFWAQDEHLDVIVAGIKDYTSENFFSRAILFALLFLWFFNLFLRKHINFLAYTASLIVGIGCLAYFTLWFPLLKNHNYYWVILVIILPAVFIPFALFVKNSNALIFKGKLTRVFLGLFLLFNIAYSVSVVKLVLKGHTGLYPLIGNNTFISEMKYSVWNEDDHWRRFEKMRPYLLEIGVEPDDKVISIPDPSFNVSLAYANRRGWTNCTYLDADDINMLIGKGAKYLFVSDDGVLKEDFIQPFLTDEIGVFKDIHIYKLAKPTPNG